MMRNLTAWTRALALAATVLLAGCGRDLLAGGYQGEVYTAVEDDPGTGASGAAGPSYQRAGAAPQGTVETVLAVQIVGDDGRVVNLTDGVATARVRLSARDSAVLSQREVPAGRYTTARVTFARVEADVASGLSVGGISVTGEVRVQIAGSVTVERPIQLVVREPSRSGVIVDLNSAAWLATTSPLQRVVAADVFASSVTVRVEP